MQVEDGRYFETEERRRIPTNKIASRKLLAKLVEVHGKSGPETEPDVVDLVRAVVRHSPVAETKAEARFIRYRADENGRKMPTVSEIKHIVATRYDVTSVNIDSRSRKHKFVLPRQIAMYLCSQLTVRSLPDIARRFGGRDHTTAIHSRDKIEEMIALDPAFAKTISEIREQLQ
jgi:chromosomal replication initiator protein